MHTVRTPSYRHRRQRHRHRILPARPKPLKLFIAAANDAVTINSFRRILPSMDDIFVSAVEALKHLCPMKSALSIIISREYLERAKAQKLHHQHLLVPVLMIALMFAPQQVMLLDTPESGTIAVIDDSGVVAKRLPKQ